MAKEFYRGGKAYLWVNGQKIGKIDNLQASMDRGAIDIFDMDNGLAGYSEGAGKVTITGTCNIPVAGPKADFDFWSASAPGAGDFDVEFTSGASSFLGTGIFKSADIQDGTQDSSKQNFTWEGQPDVLE